MNSKFQESFDKTRIAGSIAAGALDEVQKIIKPGVTTEKIDKLCYQYINDHGAYSAPLFYRGYPKSCCISANHIVCHGIPSQKILKIEELLAGVYLVKEEWIFLSSLAIHLSIYPKKMFHGQRVLLQRNLSHANTLGWRIREDLKKSIAF